MITKKIFSLFLLMPFVTRAQQLPRFERDTLYATGGYKIFIGQVLQFGNASGKSGKFQHVSLKNGASEHSLGNNSVVVKELKGFNNASHAGSWIDVTGSITFKDGSKGQVDLRLWFDRAIGNMPGVPGELVVPNNFIPASFYAAGNMARFEKDTLYTSCGYKIYKGLVLQFGKATRGSEFQYINIRGRTPHMMLQYHSILVKELDEFGVSALGNGYITIRGTLIVNNNERGDIEIHMAFDRAIENLPGIPSELVVPERFRNRVKAAPEQEVERLRNLYKYGTISLETFEWYKKKLLEQQ